MVIEIIYVYLFIITVLLCKNKNKENTSSVTSGVSKANPSTMSSTVQKSGDPSAAPTPQSINSDGFENAVKTAEEDGKEKEKTSNTNKKLNPRRNKSRTSGTEDGNDFKFNFNLKTEEECPKTDLKSEDDDNPLLKKGALQKGKNDKDKKKKKLDDKTLKTQGVEKTCEEIGATKSLPPRSKVIQSPGTPGQNKNCSVYVGDKK